MLSLKCQVWERAEPKVQLGDTGGTWTLQKLHKHNEGRRLQAAASIMNEAASQIDLVLLLQEILSPRKVLDFGELAAFFHRLSQLRPLLESEPVVPANERGQALL